MSIVFIDTEIHPQQETIMDMGGIKEDQSSYHGNDIHQFTAFMKGCSFVCGHNVIRHDLKYIDKQIEKAMIPKEHIIDTLFLSPLLFPEKPYHSLVKDDKLQNDSVNNPLNDAITTMRLFHDEKSAYFQLDQGLQTIFSKLLSQDIHFQGFFKYLKVDTTRMGVESMIRHDFKDKICLNINLLKIINDYPVALAYSLALIQTNSRYSITPPWVLKTYPEVEKVMFLLRNNPCVMGCQYCDQALDIHKGLKRFFGFDAYRKYENEPLQERAVKGAVKNHSLLAIFPTGGGKSITFQVPALMAGEAVKGLTVIISPLQSLMKDQVDNLEKAGITEAVTINGLLDPIERAKSIERVAEGMASLLYISPESLRSRTIEHLLLSRNVVRFVVDEAHCFSAWGQDFRVDYQYIGDFIKQYQQQKNLIDPIPVSCFTATAKQNVIEDIQKYFKEKLSLSMDLYRASSARTNLRYQVLMKKSKEEKYVTLRNLIEGHSCPTIIYVSRTKQAYQLAKRLSQDGYDARPYHGKMDNKEKSANQDAFTRGEVGIIVATSAFGMGVDKKDVGMVVHFNISDSLENYVQEAGRAGRDPEITADCYVLFDEEDLDKHFVLLNQTRVTINEIQQVWRAIKDLTKTRTRLSRSALEIAKNAGWDDSLDEVETRIKTAIAALEEAGYVKRGQNMPRVYADSILVKTVEEGVNRIQASLLITGKEEETAIRIIKMLISMKSREKTRDDGAESRVDYIADRLGLTKEEVVLSINLLREEKILADAKDLKVFIKKSTSHDKPIKTIKFFHQLELFLLNILEDDGKSYHIKELMEQAEQQSLQVMPMDIRIIINLWSINHWIRLKRQPNVKDHIHVQFTQSKKKLKEKLEARTALTSFIVDYLQKKGDSSNQVIEDSGYSAVDFSLLELKEAYESQMTLFNVRTSFYDLQEALFFLSRVGAISIEGGFIVSYNALSLERVEKDNRIQYKKEDYKKLEKFYESKVQQIHIVGEYAKKMVGDYTAALEFVDDYFQLNYFSFIKKYFKGAKTEDLT